jgi:hypothetical protein
MESKREKRRARKKYQEQSEETRNEEIQTIRRGKSVEADSRDGGGPPEQRIKCQMCCIANCKQLGEEEKEKCPKISGTYRLLFCRGSPAAGSNTHIR